MSTVIIIGGGAAGCMAAATAASFGHKVTLLEKNEKLGKKIYITGKGRCNFTNACDADTFFKNVVSNPKFLYSAYYSFPSESVIDFFENNGVVTKVERGNRAFPASDHASDIIRAFERKLKEEAVNVNLNTKVTSVKKIGDEFVVDTDKKTYKSDSVIICTGGFSYQTTGSTGDGYRFAKSFDMTVNAIRPALVPLNCKEEYLFRMQGLSLKNVELSIYKGTKKLYSDFGEMMFTHFGITGPLVLSASSIISKILETDQLTGYINLKPAIPVDEMDNRLLKEFKENNNKLLSSVLKKMLPGSMIDVFMELLGFDKQCNSITKEERDKIKDLFYKFPLTITSTRAYNEAIITQGGVSIKEINPSTMESKNVPGLYFAGEVLDLDAYTGGFNLQIAFSTGYLAGISII